MNTPSTTPVYTQGFGTKNLPGKIVTNVNPGTTFVPGMQIGQEWINELANTIYILTSVSTTNGVTTPTWTLLESGTSSFLSLTGDSGGAIFPSAGNINLHGGTLDSFVGAGSTITLTPKPGAYPITPYVVGPSGQAGYQTIQAAINAATAAGGGIVYVQPGTYTENITMGANIDLIGIVGTSGNAGLTIDGGEVPSVQIVGNFVLNLTAATSTPTTVLKNIQFSATTGTVFSCTGNIALLESGYISFWGCILQGAGASTIFHVDGFFNINLIQSVVTEQTVDTTNLFSFGATPFINLNCRDSFVSINGKNANTLPATSFVVFAIENTFYTARIDLSAVTASFSFNGTNSFITFDTGTAGDPLINFGSNDGHVSLQNCIINSISGSLANSTATDASSFFPYTGCTFNNPVTLGATGRGEFYSCVISGGSSAAVTMSSSQNVNFTNCVINSTHNPAIAGSGSGTISISNLSFINNANIANTLTVSPVGASDFAEVRAGADTGGANGYTSLTPTNSTTISTGTGTVKMSSTNSANNSAWIKIYIGTTAYWIPAWTTNSP